MFMHDAMTCNIAVSVKETHSSGEEDAWETCIEKHKIRDWIAVYAAVLQGKGLRKRSVCSQTPVALDTPRIILHVRVLLF